MARKFYIITFISLILLGLLGFTFIRLGFFPVVVVNSKFITEKKYNEALERKLRAIGNDEEVSHSEIKKLSLQQMIEEELVYNEAEERFGKKVRKNDAGKVRAMLIDNLSAERIIFDDWLSRAKNNASVIILVSDFSWEEGRVIAKCGLDKIC